MKSVIQSAAFGAATFRSSVRLAVVCGMLTLVGAPQAHASYVYALVSTPYGTEQVYDPTLASRSRSGFDSITGANYTAQAQTLYGVNKAFASAGATNQFIYPQAQSEWSVNFNLLGAPDGTALQLRVNIDYDFTLDRGTSLASFDLEINDDGYHPHRFYAHTTTNGFDSEGCFDRPGVTAQMFGQCGGGHAGTISALIPYTTGLNRYLKVTVGVNAAASAVSAAFNTARISSVTLPDGFTWAYTDLTGNPLNFRNARDGTGAVPEPATAGVLGLGLCGILVTAARKKK